LPLGTVRDDFSNNNKRSIIILTVLFFHRSGDAAILPLGMIFQQQQTLDHYSNDLVIPSQW